MEARCDPTNRCYTLYRADGTVQRKGCTRNCQGETAGIYNGRCDECFHSLCNRDAGRSNIGGGAVANSQPYQNNGNSGIGGGAYPKHHHPWGAGSIPTIFGSLLVLIARLL
ncbi:unnamed protein product, partial [Mesorhabditis spiculigera]